MRPAATAHDDEVAIVLLGITRQRICRRSAGDGLHLARSPDRQSIARSSATRFCASSSTRLTTPDTPRNPACRRARRQARHRFPCGPRPCSWTARHAPRTAWRRHRRQPGPWRSSEHSSRDRTHHRDHDMTEHHNGLLPSKAPSGTPPHGLETGGRSPDAQGLPLGALLSDPTVTLPSFKQVTHRVEPAHDYTPCSARAAADP